jgi:DNA primase
MGKLEEALEYIDLEEWVDKYVETKHGGVDEIRVQECPKCLNDKWKLYINVEKKIWFCQRCQWGRHSRDVCELLAEIANINIHTMRIEVANTIVPSVPGEEYLSKLEEELATKPVGEEFIMDPIDLPGQEGLEGVMGEKAKKYLLSRGLTMADIAFYKIRLANKLRNNIGPWAVFPVLYYDVPVACQGRKFTNNDEPRYLSSDKIANWLWPLDPTNLENIKDKRYVVLVEGVFDALAYIKTGIPALCTFGKNLSKSQLKLLRSHNIEKIYLSYDADAHKDIQKTADRIGHQFHTYIIELIPLPENPKADPGDVLSGQVDPKWLTESFEEAVDTRSSEWWNWKLRKDLGL